MKVFNRMMVVLSTRLESMRRFGHEAMDLAARCHRLSDWWNGWLWECQSLLAAKQVALIRERIRWARRQLEKVKGGDS